MTNAEMKHQTRAS